MQPVLGAGLSADQARQDYKRAQDDLQAFWASIGVSKRGGLKVRDMAGKVGLSSTYEYIYFAASNFVHFNPQALLRTGWGPELGPFSFSMYNMEDYYRSFSRFYGAVLFIGFQASFGDRYRMVSLDAEVTRLIELIDHIQRWPEVITCEEMNKRPPLYLLTHALREVMREKDRTIPYGSILNEVQALKRSRETQ